MNIKKTIKHRPSRLLAIVFWTIGFTFTFLAQLRVENQFGHDAQGPFIKFGWSTENQQWLPAHYGSIGIVLIFIGLICFLNDHHKEANK